MTKTFFCIDAHTCGNPVRLVAGGGPNLQGHNMSEKRQHFLKEFDWIRKGLMFEPRGHDMMSGSILYPPHNPENDVAVLFIETSGCLPMCGHGTIGTITIAIEEGLISPKTPGIVRMEAPAGLVLISYNQAGNKVKSVKLVNVPAYLAAENLEVECPDLGSIKVDVSYGGNFYAIVDPQANFTGLENYTADQLISWSRVPKTQPLTAVRIYFGRAKPSRRKQLHAMLFFMEIRQLIVPHAERELRHVWPNGMQKGS